MSISFSSDRTSLLKTLRAVVSVALTAGATYFIVTRALRDYPEFRGKVLSYPLWSIAGCSGIFFVVVFLEAAIWYESLKDMADEPLPLQFSEALRVFAISNLAKYIPGRIWMFCHQSSMLSERGVSLKTTAALNLSLAVYGVLSALLVGCVCLLGLPLALWIKVTAALIITGILLLHPVLPEKHTRHDGLKMAAFFLTWTLHGCAGVLLMRSLSPIGWVQGLQIVGGMALSWLVGAGALFAPAGLGVREAVLYLTMVRMPEGLRLSLPVMTRICLLLAEGMMLVVALLWRAICNVQQER